MIVPLRARLLLAVGLLSPSLGMAQGRGIDVTYGRWWHGAPANLYTASYSRPLLGPFDYGIGVTHLDDSRALDDRTQTGAEVSLGWGKRGGGPYVVAAGGLAMRHMDRNVDAGWSAGAGYAWRPLSFLTLGLEARYRVEDRNARGFWQLDPVDRRGWVVQARLGFGASYPTRRRPVYEAPKGSEVREYARAAGASGEAAETAVQVVQTALDAMGTPYRWGGDGDNGYDCSGLIQFAYGQHGILLPRVSRDQARTGLLIERDLAQLRPGDILGFADGGNGISHVGLYVGEGRFIHSSSSGVKLSSLDGADPDGRYWRQRWAVVRRVLN